MKFAEALRSVITQKKLSVTELSRRSGIARELLHQYLAGTRKYPTIRQFQRIANGLGLKPWIFLKKIINNSYSFTQKE